MTPCATEQALTVFVPTRLVNPTNAREGHWAARAKRAKAQREAVGLAVLMALRPDRWARLATWRIVANPETPKAITFTATVARRLDDDGLVASLKACRDGLIDCGLIQDDGPDSGHVFTYAQQTGQPYGVMISVALHPAQR